MTVTFCGHREVDEPEQVREWLRETVRRLAETGAAEFCMGDNGAFDRMAAGVVSELRRDFSGIRSVLILAYPDHPAYDAALYDGSVYPGLESIPRRFAISHRNRWMVERADCVLVYVRYGWGGAAQTLEYARRKGKRVILYPQLP